MSTYQSKGLLITGVLLLAATLLAVAAVAVPSLFDSPAVKAIRAQLKLFGESQPQERLYVETDKTFYKPGETLWFSAFLRDAASLQPSKNSDVLHVELITPKGTTAKHYKLVAKDGIAEGDFDLSGCIGGIYKIKAWTQFQRNSGDTSFFEKEITVQSVVMPRLKMNLDFDRKAYGKSDEVTATLKLNTNSNTPLANTKVKFSAQLDGVSFKDDQTITNATGIAKISFRLPADLKTTDGLLNAKIDFEGSTEAISRSIPIVLNQIALEFFPEGGDMVNGIHNKLAFRARNEFDKAADVEGVVKDNTGAVVTTFKSLHMGMGAFDFTPVAGKTYSATITKPEGITAVYNLPAPLLRGYALQATTNENNIELRVVALKAETLTVVAQSRGMIYYSGSWNAAAGENSLSIPTNKFPQGIAQITLFDGKNVARCERLCFVNRTKGLKISITADKPVYRPRETVKLNILATDASGLPVSGNFALSVVDDNLLSFADDKQGNLLSAMLLEPELLEKVQEPKFYFDENEKDAAAALDNLMLTSGWRRYSWKKILSGDFPRNKAEGEKATLAGSVINAYDGTKGIGGAKVKLLPSGKNVTTDASGKFNLGWFDITRDTAIEISANGFTTLNEPLSEYNANATFYLYDHRHPILFEKRMMPMAAGGVMMRGARNGQVEMEDAVAAPMEMHLNLNEVKEEQRADQAELIKQKDEEVAKADEVQSIAVGDLRDADLYKFDKKVQDESGVVFYRAKEFPKRAYQKGETERNDFQSTLFWKGNLETSENGKASVSFMTNDLISSFNVQVSGISDEGTVGMGNYRFATELPFSMDVKLPVELVSGDKILVPVFLKNNTTETLTGTLRVDDIPCLKLLNSFDGNISIEAKQSHMVYISYQAAVAKDTCDLHLVFEGSKVRDEMRKPVKVISRGFPANISMSGQDLSKKFNINITDVVPGSMNAQLTAYPSVMNELMAGVDAILREPYGCFEQTSSSNYPNVMAMTYLRTMNVKNPILEERAKKLLDDGYKKLVSFETKENGYEWFGAAPSHEALTAYGLMEFEDMKKVYPGVDQAMIDRTRKVLMDKRDGNGGFKRNPQALDAFGGADEDITNAYIVYSLTEAGQKDLQKELDAAYKNAKKTSDPYLMALVANALFNVGDQERGDEIIREIVKQRNEYGFWTGKRHSITRSTGDALKIETTSLIALAMMKSKNTPNEALTGAIKYLVGARSGYGNFGSTQSTVLALKALTRYAEFSRKTEESGTVEVYVNDKLVASKSYEKGVKDNVVLSGLEQFIGLGKQEVSVRFKGCKNALPYAMNVSYNTALPVSSPKCVLGLDVNLVTGKIVEVGNTVRLNVQLKNLTNSGQPMSIAVIGIPAGCSAQPWQLKELMEKKAIDFYEITGNNVVCYYRSLAPKAVKEIALDLKAEVKGEFEAPASSAYLYYTNENKVWKAMEKLEIE
ncbi:MAG: MG2 domain-containing protein [Chitinophagales bacterium]